MVVVQRLVIEGPEKEEEGKWQEKEEEGEVVQRL